MLHFIPRSLIATPQHSHTSMPFSYCCLYPTFLSAVVFLAKFLLIIQFQIDPPLGSRLRRRPWKGETDMPSGPAPPLPCKSVSAPAPRSSVPPRAASRASALPPPGPSASEEPAAPDPAKMARRSRHRLLLLLLRYLVVALDCKLLGYRHPPTHSC